jgi:hypothetical protein
MAPRTVPDLHDTLVQIALDQAAGHRPLRVVSLQPVETEDGRRTVRRYAYQCSRDGCLLRRFPDEPDDFHATVDEADAAWYRAHCPRLPVSTGEFR